jgi:hypothetical protein
MVGFAAKITEAQCFFCYKKGEQRSLSTETSIMRMRRFRRVCRWAVLPLLVLGSGAYAFASDVPCTPAFPLQTGEMHGWMGADAAYSIPLGDGRDLWIFGDTLEGTKRVVENSIPMMVRNSVGVSTCSASGRWQIQYSIRRDGKGEPADFFAAQHPHTWYWAMDGFRAGADVWVTLLCLRATNDQSAMGFATCGSDLAKIASPGPDPQQWKITYFPLVDDGAHAYPSATTVIDGSDVDLFALDEQGARPLIAARIPLSGLDRPRQNLEYLAADGKWTNGFEPANAKPIMTPGISELSIRYHPELKRWLAVMFVPGGLSRDIIVRSAPAATGPWSDGQVIYSVPEMKPESPGYDKDTFCYAAKEHPEFEHHDLLFTYVCNTFAVPKLATEMNIYFPRVVRLPMPAMHDDAATGAGARQ